MVWKQIQAGKHCREEEKDTVKILISQQWWLEKYISRHLDVNFSAFEKGRLNQRALSVWLPWKCEMLSLKLRSMSISDVSISDIINKAEEEMFL